MRSDRGFAAGAIPRLETCREDRGRSGDRQLLRRFLAVGWLERTDGSRALRVTPPERRGFRDVLAIDALDSRFS